MRPTVLIAVPFINIASSEHYYEDALEDSVHLKNLFVALPTELFEKILNQLDQNTYRSLAGASKEWREQLTNPNQVGFLRALKNEPLSTKRIIPYQNFKNIYKIYISNAVAIDFLNMKELDEFLSFNIVF